MVLGGLGGKAEVLGAIALAMSHVPDETLAPVSASPGGSPSASRAEQALGAGGLARARAVQRTNRSERSAGDAGVGEPDRRDRGVDRRWRAPAIFSRARTAAPGARAG